MQESSAQAGRWLGGLCSWQQADTQEDGGDKQGTDYKGPISCWLLGDFAPRSEHLHKISEVVSSPLTHCTGQGKLLRQRCSGVPRGTGVQDSDLQGKAGRTRRVALAPFPPALVLDTGFPSTAADS